MAPGDPDALVVFRRRLRLTLRMIWHSRFPTAGEARARSERLATRAELEGQQRLAAAAFRWRLVQQRSERSIERRFDA